MSTIEQYERIIADYTIKYGSWELTSLTGRHCKRILTRIFQISFTRFPNENIKYFYHEIIYTQNRTVFSPVKLTIDVIELIIIRTYFYSIFKFSRK